MRQEQIDAAYARDAIAAAERPRGRGVRPEWEEKRWLEPHLVAVLEPAGLGFRQVTVARAGERPLRDLRAAGGTSSTS